MSIGGQSLRTEMRVPESTHLDGLDHILFNAPSVSPLGSSNPGFSFITLRNQNESDPHYELSDIEMHHLQLYNHLIYRSDVWTQISVRDDLPGIDYLRLNNST